MIHFIFRFTLIAGYRRNALMGCNLLLRYTAEVKQKTVLSLSSIFFTWNTFYLNRVNFFMYFIYITVFQVAQQRLESTKKAIVCTFLALCQRFIYALCATWDLLHNFLLHKFLYTFYLHNNIFFYITVLMQTL